MLNLGMGELVLIALVALILIPAKELPKVATSLGRFVAGLQRSFNKIKSDFDYGLHEPDEPKTHSQTDPKKDRSHEIV